MDQIRLALLLDQVSNHANDLRRGARGKKQQHILLGVGASARCAGFSSRRWLRARAFQRVGGFIVRNIAPARGGVRSPTRDGKGYVKVTAEHVEGSRRARIAQIVIGKVTVEDRTTMRTKGRLSSGTKSLLPVKDTGPSSASSLSRESSTASSFPMTRTRSHRIDRIGPAFHAGAEWKGDLKAALSTCTSSMAYSSARRLGCSRLGGVPHTQIFAFWICGMMRRRNEVRRRHHAVS